MPRLLIIFSSTYCLLQGTQSIAGIMRDGSNEWDSGQLMPWTGWRSWNCRDNTIKEQRGGRAHQPVRLGEVVIGTL
jgi:hypothetical protein